MRAFLYKILFQCFPPQRRLVLSGLLNQQFCLLKQKIKFFLLYCEEGSVCLIFTLDCPDIPGAANVKIVCPGTWGSRTWISSRISILILIHTETFQCSGSGRSCPRYQVNLSSGRGTQPLALGFPLGGSFHLQALTMAFLDHAALDDQPNIVLVLSSWISMGSSGAFIRAGWNTGSVHSGVWWSRFPGVLPMAVLSACPVMWFISPAECYSASPVIEVGVAGRE